MKHSNVADDEILILFLIIIFISCLLILFTDVLYLFFKERSGVKQTNSKTLWFFVLIYAAGFSALIHETFDPSFFCAMNFNQKLCRDRRRPVLLKYGAFQTQNSTPLLRSSPCEFEVDRFVIGLFFLLIYFFTDSLRFDFDSKTNHQRKMIHDSPTFDLHLQLNNGWWEKSNFRYIFLVYAVFFYFQV